MKDSTKSNFQMVAKSRENLPESLSRLRTPIRRLYCHIEEEYDIINAKTLTEGHKKRLVKEKIFAGLNRYCDVLPFRDNIVKLDDCETVNVDNYINANFITHPFKKAEKSFIACQAPMNDTMESFCRMVLKYKVEDVITIINKKEDPHRYFNYWSASQTYGSHKICVEYAAESGPFCSLSVLKISDEKEQSEQIVNHFHILNWQDYRALSKDQISEFVKFLKMILKNKSESELPTVVHCSAGIGRTLTFICSYYLVEQNTHPDGEQQIVKYNVRDLVSGFREQRYNAINTLHQYKFLYEVVHFLQEGSE